MNRFQAALSGLKTQQSSGSGGDDATQKAISRFAPSLARNLTRDEISIGGSMVHYGFGTMMGAVYGGAAEVMPRTSMAWGLPFGAALWLGGDEIAVPLAGLSSAPGDYPASTHASALAAHLVYGLTADVVRRAVRATL